MKSGGRRGEHASLAYRTIWIAWERRWGRKRKQKGEKRKKKKQRKINKSFAFDVQSVV